MDYNKNKVLIKRIFAYIIDMAIITIFTMLIAKINFINPYNDQYRSLQEEYQQMLNEASSPNDVLKNEGYADLYYNMSKYGAVYNIIDGLVLIGYFVFFQKANKGQTVGKALMKVRVVSCDDEKLSIKQLFLRSLVIYQFVVYIICGVLIFVLSKNSYNIFNNYFSLIFMIASYVALVMALFRQDCRGLHDLFANTQVVPANMTKEEIKEESVEEKQSKEKPVKKTKKEKVVDAKYEEKPKKKTTRTKKGQK